MPQGGVLEATTGGIDAFSNVFISFGTAFGREVATGGAGSTTTDATPESAGLMLVGAGPIGLSMLKRRRPQPPEL